MVSAERNGFHLKNCFHLKIASSKKESLHEKEPLLIKGIAATERNDFHKKIDSTKKNNFLQNFLFTVSLYKLSLGIDNYEL